MLNYGSSIGPHVSFAEIRRVLLQKKMQLLEAENRADRERYDLLESQIYSLEQAIEDRAFALRFRKR